MTKDVEKHEIKLKEIRAQVDRIVKVAHRLFEKHGFEHVGMREISAAAKKVPCRSID